MERLEDAVLLGIRDARPVIGHGDAHLGALALGAYRDAAARGRVRDGVVYEVDERLDREGGVGAHEQGLRRRLEGHDVAGAARGVAQRLLDEVVHELRVRLRAHAALLEARDGEEVLHGGAQPGGVVADGRQQLPARARAEGGSGVEKDVGVARDRGEGRAQVVGDRAQQVRAGPLLAGADGGLLAGPERRHAVEGERRQAADRAPELELLGGEVGGRKDARHAPRRGGRAHGQVEARGGAEGLRRGAGRAPVGERAQGDGALVCHGRPGREGEGGEVAEGARVAAGGIPDKRAAEQLRRASRHRGHHVVGGGAVLEPAAQVQEGLRLEAGGLGGAGLEAQPRGDVAGEQRHDEHDREGPRHRGVECRERERGRGEEEVEGEDGERGGDQAPRPSRRGERHADDGQHVGDHDGGLLQARRAQQRPRGRGGREQPHGHEG